MEDCESTKNKSDDILSLENCFSKIIGGEAIEIDLSNAYNFLNELQVNCNNLQPKSSTVLPFLLVHFIKSWPGWQKKTAYLNNKITIDSWFKKFKEYLTFKLNFIIKSEIQKMCDDIEQLSINNQFLFGIDNSTQTDMSVVKYTAPYSILIEAPPRFLNTIIFMEGDDGKKPIYLSITINL